LSLDTLKDGLPSGEILSLALDTFLPDKTSPVAGFK